MKLRFFLLLAGSIFFAGLQAQNLSGQWSGGFNSTGDYSGGQIEYVLELEVSGTRVEGFSYSYFIINGKRHYVICKLNGSYDKGSKSLIVNEIGKVKSNTPPDFKDLFQTHMLTFMKQGDKEILQGRWKPAYSKQVLQSGETFLERKALVRVAPAKPNNSIAQDNKVQKSQPDSPVKISTNNPTLPVKQPSATTRSTPSTATKKPVPSKQSSSNPTVKQPAPTTRSTTNPAVKQPAPALQKPKTSAPSNGTREVANAGKPLQKPASVEKSQTKIDNPVSPMVISGSQAAKLEKRNKQLIQIIEVPEATCKVDLYDNGQVDGDTISVFYNGKLVVSSKRLSTTPITLTIKMDPDRIENELVMYAENLGSIPPNTALMVVTVGDKRYEVNITSTEQSNGTVRFRLKE